MCQAATRDLSPHTPDSYRVCDIPRRCRLYPHCLCVAEKKETQQWRSCEIALSGVVCVVGDGVLRGVRVSAVCWPGRAARSRRTPRAPLVSSTYIFG